MGWLLAILAGGLFTFNAVVTPDRAASEAEKALKKQFPGAEVDVKIEGKRGNDVLNGRFRRIDIELAKLALDELPISASATATQTSANAPNVVRQADGKIQVGQPRAPGAPALKPVETKLSKPPKAKIGRAGELNIAVREFRWQNLPIERADFQFNNVEYDFGALKNRSQFKLVRVGKASMHLELAPDALTPFIAKRVANVSNASVKLNDGQVSVGGARNFYGVSAPFEVRGQPSFSGSQVILKSPKLLVSGVSVPALVATPILKSVNPLYSFDDLEDLPFAVTLTKVEARDGKLQIDGDLTLKR